MSILLWHCINNVISCKYSFILAYYNITYVLQLKEDTQRMLIYTFYMENIYLGFLLLIEKLYYVPSSDDCWEGRKCRDRQDFDTGDRRHQRQLQPWDHMFCCSVQLILTLQWYCQPLCYRDSDLVNLYQDDGGYGFPSFQDPPVLESVWWHGRTSNIYEASCFN